MKQLTTIILTILMLAPITAQNKNFIDQPYIEVTGKFEKEIVPDLIYLKVIINERDKLSKLSLEQQEQKMMKTLKSIGINTNKDVSIIDFSSNFQSYLLKKSDIRTSKEYQVLVNNGNMAARVFLELEKMDISNISVAKLDHTKMDEFKQTVKVEAIKNAKEKASQLCEAIDQNAGKAIYIQEINRGFYGGRMDMRESKAMFKVRGEGINMAKEINIEFQKLKLEYEIQARFTIE